MKWLKIDGREWNVKVIGITENFNVLYSENTGRTMAAGAPIVLDPLGTFYGHKISVRRNGDDLDEFDDLFDFVSKPHATGILVEAVHGQTMISYLAYVSNGERKVDKIDPKSGKVYYSTVEFNIIPMEAQVRP